MSNYRLRNKKKNLKLPKVKKIHNYMQLSLLEYFEDYVCMMSHKTLKKASTHLNQNMFQEEI